MCSAFYVICPVFSCYKTFETEALLHQHIPQHMATKHSRVHICPYCGKSYSIATYLIKHLEKHKDFRHSHDTHFRKVRSRHEVDGTGFGNAEETVAGITGKHLRSLRLSTRSTLETAKFVASLATLATLGVFLQELQSRTRFCYSAIFRQPNEEPRASLTVAFAANASSAFIVVPVQRFKPLLDPITGFCLI